MRLKRRIFAQRLSRLRQRAQPAAPELARSIIELPNRDLAHDRCVPASATRACGTAIVWTDKPHGRRRSERVPVASHASVRRFGGFPFDLQLGDISIGGCRVELLEAAQVRDRVIARLPGLEPFGAAVAWTEGRSAGLTFDRVIHPAVFEHLLLRLV